MSAEALESSWRNWQRKRRDLVDCGAFLDWSMGLSFVLFPSSYCGFLGAQLEKAACIPRLKLKSHLPHFLSYMRQQVHSNLFSLNVSLPKWFLLKLDFSSTREATGTRGLKKNKVSIPKEAVGEEVEASDSSVEDPFLTKKSVLIAEWLQDTEKIFAGRGENAVRLERKTDPRVRKEEQCYPELSSTRKHEPSVLFKLSGVLIVSVQNGNRFFIAFLQVIATFIIFFVSSLGDGIQLVALKFSSVKNSTKLNS